jgi:acetyltransferase-like isoleucine patch superfamily enzyme
MSAFSQHVGAAMAGMPRLRAFLRKVRMGGLWRPNWCRLRGRNNRVVSSGACLVGCVIEIHGSNNEVLIQPDCILRGVRIRLVGDRHRVEIGPTVYMGPSTVWLVGEGNSVVIGERTSFERVGIAATDIGTRIRIGGGCMVAYDVDIRSGDSHPVFDQATGTRLNPGADVLIHDRVWLGARSMILKGVELGHDSVVGAGAVVTQGRYPAHCALGGNPARVLREGVSWRR